MDVVIVDRDKEHSRHLKNVSFNYYMRKNLDFEVYEKSDTNQALSHLKSSNLSEICMIETKADMKLFIERVRSEKPEEYIVLIAADMAELLTSITPRIRPSGALIRPAKKSDIENLLAEIEEDNRSRADGKVFVFSVQSKTYTLAMETIVYFMASNKKITIRTASQEFEFYGSLAEIEEKIGKEFMRIHKSFIVNTNRIEAVNFAEMTVEFDEGSVAYVSRSYRQKLKEYMDNKNEL